jgi:plasmid maintenance system antidote protein VapI
MNSYGVRAAVLQEMGHRHMSMSGLARQLGWPVDYLVAILGGRRPLTGTERWKLGDALGIPTLPGA